MRGERLRRLRQRVADDQIERREQMGEDGQMRPRLHAGTDDRHGGDLRRGESGHGHSAYRGGAETGDLARIHDAQRPASVGAFRTMSPMMYGRSWVRFSG